MLVSRMTTAERSAKYRAKDVDAYRAMKRALTRAPEHREVRRLYMQKWRAEHRERHNEICRASHHRNKHKHVGKARTAMLARDYGLTDAEYAAMLQKQEGRCAICGTDKPGGKYGKNFHVDHSHSTGRVRGLLCSMCNGRVGTLEAWYSQRKAQIDAYLGEDKTW